MKRILSIAVLALAAIAHTAQAQIYSLAGNCSGTFKCDHVTVFSAAGSTALQFTEQRGKWTYYLIFAGTGTEGDTFQVNAVGKNGTIINTEGHCSISSKICTTSAEHVVFHQKGRVK